MFFGLKVHGPKRTGRSVARKKRLGTKHQSIVGPVPAQLKIFDGGLLDVKSFHHWVPFHVRYRYCPRLVFWRYVKFDVGHVQHSLSTFSPPTFSPSKLGLLTFSQWIAAIMPEKCWKFFQKWENSILFMLSNADVRIFCYFLEKNKTKTLFTLVYRKA